MAIEINNVPPSSAQVSELGSHRAGGSTPTPTEKVAEKNSAPSPAADQVSLTPAAQQLRSLEQQIAEQPVVDTQKVNAVKELQASGRFEIDPNRIADKMMSLERALGDMG
ncbi:MAG: flagellar biosynthesis anti-sigma factor FlgM [Gammaproteobacteria bacterium]|nr:flagellar biosynthesis anti-sigma factor FlgM [Gammaproteobacteria bacterium]